MRSWFTFPALPALHSLKECRQFDPAVAAAWLAQSFLLRGTHTETFELLPEKALRARSVLRARGPPAGAQNHPGTPLQRHSEARNFPQTWPRRNPAGAPSRPGVASHSLVIPEIERLAPPGGNPPSAVSISSAGLGSNSNNKGASVGEGFSILRMPAIVREGRTLQVENS